MRDNPMSVVELPAVAAGPLAAWQDIARSWATFKVLDVDTGSYVQRCGSCFGGIYRVDDRTHKPYPYSEADLLALTVAHLRMSHMDLDPDR